MGPGTENAALTSKTYQDQSYNSLALAAFYLQSFGGLDSVIIELSYSQSYKQNLKKKWSVRCLWSFVLLSLLNS